MKTAFVVMQCVRDYSQSSEIPILVTTSPELAASKVTEMEARKHTARFSTNDKIVRHMKQWDIDYPSPPRVSPTLRLVELPTFSKHKNKWTKEQLAEYNAVDSANKKKQIEATEPFYSWMKRRYIEQKRFTETFAQQKQDDLLNLNEDTFWEIQTAPFVE